MLVHTSKKNVVRREPVFCLLLFPSLLSLTNLLCGSYSWELNHWQRFLKPCLNTIDFPPLLLPVLLRCKWSHNFLGFTHKNLKIRSSRDSLKNPPSATCFKFTNFTNNKNSVSQFMVIRYLNQIYIKFYLDYVYALVSVSE